VERPDGRAAGGPLLVAEDLRKEYGAPSGPLVILEGVSLTVRPGEPVSILGPSGSGKSTLLHVLGALEPPSGGRVRLSGVDPYGLPEAAQADFRNRHIGFVFQDHHLLPQLTLLENVLVPALVRRDRRSAGYEPRARALLDRVGLGGRLDHLPSELSGGERQRAAIARALLGAPELVLADEPTGNLDRRTAADVGALLLELGREEERILLAVTHSLDLASRFPRRFELDGGRLQER
jgi:lipoprotein-releasing system ATP-binding protein